MPRSQKKVQPAPATAPLAEPNPIVTAISRDDTYRAWRQDRTRQVYEAADYTAVTALYADYQSYAEATFGRAAVMSEPDFAILTGQWPRHIVKHLPVRRFSGVGPKYGFAANLKLLPALRVAA